MFSRSTGSTTSQNLSWRTDIRVLISRMCERRSVGIPVLYLRPAFTHTKTCISGVSGRGSTSGKGRAKLGTSLPAAMKYFILLYIACASASTLLPMCMAGTSGSSAISPWRSFFHFAVHPDIRIGNEKSVALHRHHGIG